VVEVRRTAPVEARWLGGYRARVSARQFSTEVDEPPSAGGTDAGPMPTELLLMSLASCFALAMAHVARRDQVEIGAFTVTAEGIYEGPSLSAFELSVRMEELVPADVDELLRKAQRVCYVSNTLARQPGIVARVVD
jgi:putative redox protein